jgi:hypothetical protein
LGLKIKSSATTEADAPTSPAATPRSEPKGEPASEPAEASMGLKLTPAATAAAAPITRPPPLKQKTPTTPADAAPKEPIATKAAAATPPRLQKQKETKSDLNAPSKSSVLTSILIVVVLMFILAAATRGIWLLLKDMGQPATTEQAVASPASTPASSGTNLSTPIKKAQATIETAETADELTTIESLTEDIAVIEPKIIRPAPRSLPVKQDGVAPKAAEPQSYQAAVTHFLSTAYIGGVRNGANAKLIIDGRSYTIGSVVDENTGLTFLGTREGRLVFKDGNEVIYVKTF